jgi:voltage-gated potassium channel Kch
MKKKSTVKQRIIYGIDCMFSKGTSVMILWLGIASLLIILLASILIVLFRISPQNSLESVSFIEAFWISLMRTLDPGTMSDDQGWAFRILMLLVTLGGVFIISAFIGVISSGFISKLENLQRGRSFVLEDNHTVILGWNDKIFTILKELCSANQNKNDACIVVMGEKDKVDMVEQINEKLPDKGATRIVCRNGSPIDQTSLNLLNLNFAKSIIVISPMSEDPDSEVIKTCLAIIRNPNRLKNEFHIVAELRQAKNLSVAKIVGGNEVEWVLSEDIIAKMIAQTCFQPGLSTIFTDLMDFSGDEIYFFEHPSLIGRTFGYSLQLFEKNTVLGIWKSSKTPILNPHMETIIEEKDKIILLAEDDDQIRLDTFSNDLVFEDQIRNFTNEKEINEKILIIGWNSRSNRLLQEMSHYIPNNSEITILTNKSLIDNTDDWESIFLQNAKLNFIDGVTTNREILDSLGLNEFNHVILLSHSNQLSHQAADAKTLITLLHLRDIASKNELCNYSILTEMLDVRNLELAEVTKADDFIVSDRFISLLLTQISEGKGLSKVFEDLFNSEGAEIYLKSARNYVSLNQDVNFFTVVESAKRKNEVAIGYRIGRETSNPHLSYGIVLNPHKSKMRPFRNDDQIIVLSETY